MILDSGICSVFHPQDMSLSGEMPRPGYQLLTVGWYGELSFETAQARPTEGRRELKTDHRIRILQCRAIKQDDVVVLRELASFSDRSADDVVYRIARAFHGTDEKTAEPISDLSLEVYQP